MTYLDSTILTVALPTLEKDLHASIAGLQWVSDAYLLVVASLLMLTGSPPTGWGASGCSSSAWPGSAWARCCARSRRTPGR